MLHLCFMGRRGCISVGVLSNAVIGVHNLSYVGREAWTEQNCLHSRCFISIRAQPSHWWGHRHFWRGRTIRGVPQEEGELHITGTHNLLLSHTHTHTHTQVSESHMKPCFPFPVKKETKSSKQQIGASTDNTLANIIPHPRWHQQM